jgi:hypothetical protein
MEEEICLVDSCTTNSILRETKYFQTLTHRSRNVLTIAGRDAMIVGSRRATIMFPNGTQVTIEDALLYPDSTRAQWNNFLIPYVSGNSKASIFAIDRRRDCILYGSLDLDIYMKASDGISVPNVNVGCNMYYVKQLKHLPTGILIHQLVYVQKVLEKFNMDKAYPSKTPMVVRALEKDIDLFRPRQKGEEVLGSEYSYLSAIGALMYLANNTRPDISFVVNLLGRYSAAPTMHHWNGVKDVLRYLQDTLDLGLFYLKNQDLSLIGYADAAYLSDPHNGKS